MVSRAGHRHRHRRAAQHAFAPAGSVGNAWVELFRNIPLLVQMFLWFFVVPEFLPRDWSLWVKQDMPAKEFSRRALPRLVTSARVAEQYAPGSAACHVTA